MDYRNINISCTTSKDFDTCYLPVINCFLQKTIRYLGWRHPRSSEITIIVIINQGSSYNYKSGHNYYKSEQLQTITIWERFVTNQGSCCKLEQLLKIDAQQHYRE